jgi:hypothetical protein
VTTQTDTLFVGAQAIGVVQSQNASSTCVAARQFRALATITAASVDSVEIVERATYSSLLPRYARPVARVWRVSGDSGRRGFVLWESGAVNGACGTVGQAPSLIGTTFTIGSSTLRGVRTPAAGFAWWSGISTDVFPTNLFVVTLGDSVIVTATSVGTPTIIMGVTYSYSALKPFAVGMQGSADHQEGRVTFRVLAASAVGSDSTTVSVERSGPRGVWKPNTIDTVQLRLRRESP